MIHLGLRLTRQGHLACDTAAEMPSLDEAVAARLSTAFARDGGYGLLRLGAGEIGQALPPVFVWWRDFAIRYVTALCHAADSESQRTAPAATPEVPGPTEADLATLVLTAPLMPGAEYLTPEVLHALWAAMAASLAVALVEAGTDLQAFLKGMNPAWNLVDFIPGPPRSLFKIPPDERRRNLRRLFARFPLIVKQALTPFDDRPTEPSPLPQDDVDIPPEQVEHCEWIFDQAEQRAASLEQKAQWTFGLIAFLAPLLAGSLVFLLKEPMNAASYRYTAISIICGASVLLLLGFICALRAVSVRRRDTLYLGSALDMSTGQFREYKKAFRARGLLYCASMNHAMNDHIANFVKSAHIFSAIAVVLLVIAAIPVSMGISGRKPMLVDAKIVSPVAVTSKELRDLGNQVASLHSELALLRAGNDQIQRAQWYRVLDARMTKVEAEILDLAKVVASREARTPAPGKAQGGRRPEPR